MNTLAISQRGFEAKINVFGKTHVSYSSCEHLWSYLGKIVLLSRSILNAAARTCSVIALVGKNFPNVVKEVTTRLKLFSIVSVPFSVVNIDLAARKIFDRFLVKDWEGTALSSLSFTVIAADIIDSLMTFTNASLVLTSRDPIQLFSRLDLPLAFTMAGLGTILRTVQIAKNLNHHAHGISLFAKESASGGDTKEFAKKIRIDVLGISANVFMLTALTLFTLGTATALPQVLKSVAFSIRLVALYHQDQEIKY